MKTSNIVLAALGLTQIKALNLEQMNCDCLDNPGIPFKTRENGERFIEWRDPQCNIYEYPATYGAEGCKDYDAGMAPNCDGDNPPDFCSKKWCYVDISCTASDLLRTNLPGVTLGYSYMICGNTATFPE